MDNLFGDSADEVDDFDTLAEIEAEIDAATPEFYEPRNNPHFMGHDDIESGLLRDFNAGRMPHAIVLAGAPGIGKATLAFRLARFLLSQEDGGGLFGGDAAPAQTMDIALDHPVFRRVSSGGHADLMVVERGIDEKSGRLKKDIPVDSVRKIAPFLRKTAAEGGWRVVIVDGAEALNASSQNALLKILEEPPAKTVLILTTTKPGSFLPTIRSRCRMMAMDALTDQTMKDLLSVYRPDLESHDMDALLTMSEGSIGRALQYDEDDALSLREDLLQIIADMPQLDMLKVHDLAGRVGGRGNAQKDYDTLRDILTDWCARQARTFARGEKGLVAGAFDKLARTYPPQHFFHAWEKIRDVFAQTERFNLDKKQAVIGAFLALQDPSYEGLTI